MADLSALQREKKTLRDVRSGENEYGNVPSTKIPNVLSAGNSSGLSHNQQGPLPQPSLAQSQSFDGAGQDNNPGQSNDNPNPSNNQEAQHTFINSFTPKPAPSPKLERR